jgi:hypothetical protein
MKDGLLPIKKINCGRSPAGKISLDEGGKIVYY